MCSEAGRAGAQTAGRAGGGCGRERGAGRLAGSGGWAFEWESQRRRRLRAQGSCLILRGGGGQEDLSFQFGTHTHTHTALGGGVRDSMPGAGAAGTQGTGQSRQTSWRRRGGGACTRSVPSGHPPSWEKGRGMFPVGEDLVICALASPCTDVCTHARVGPADERVHAGACPRVSQRTWGAQMRTRVDAHTSAFLPGAWLQAGGAVCACRWTREEHVCGWVCV